MTKPIRGKIARVLNTREIALNVGTAQGVTRGMRFDVMDTNEMDITDPDTGKVLGSLERPKITVEIIHVQEDLSVAQTPETSVNVGGTGTLTSLGTLGPVARSLMPPNWVTRYETLRKTVNTKEELDEADSRVKTGDPVVQVLKTGEANQYEESPGPDAEFSEQYDEDRGGVSIKSLRS